MTRCGKLRISRPRALSPFGERETGGEDAASAFPKDVVPGASRWVARTGGVLRWLAVTKAGRNCARHRFHHNEITYVIIVSLPRGE